MNNTKPVLAAASLTVALAAGIGAVSAAPWDADKTQLRHDHRILDRDPVSATRSK